MFKRFGILMQLFRWKNLLIVFVTQLMIWTFIFYPLRLNAHLTFSMFLLLSVSTILIAAGGYVINDFYDLTADKINKPDKVYVGKYFSRRTTKWIYFVLNILAVVAAVFPVQNSGNFLLLGIQFFCIMLLWLYAQKLKGTILLGNFSVSLLIALTILILPAYEPKIYSYAHFETWVQPGQERVLNPLLLIVVYAIFAFLTTMMREVVKDLQDREGDAAQGWKTLAVQQGEQKAKRWVYGFAQIVFALLLVIAFVLFQSKWKFLSAYIVIGLMLPDVLIMFSLRKSHVTGDYSSLSKRIKWLMLAGLGAIPVYFLLAYIF